MNERALVKQLERSRERIGKERDALRRLQEDVGALLDSTERAAEALDSAIDALSEYA